MGGIVHTRLLVARDARVEGHRCNIYLQLVYGLGVRVHRLWFRAQGSEFRTQGSGFRVQGSGLRVLGLGF
jgi:hypothetical protein